MKPTVLLFDIDGTLVTTGGVGRRALDKAFDTLHGRADACLFALDGMTDGMIVRLGLAEIGVAVSDAAVHTVLQLYLKNLAHEVARAAPETYRLHLGMREAVETALATSGFAVGLGTGNLHEGARLKLERLHFFHPFRFGGFGSDHDNRTVLIGVGARRGAEALGIPPSECRVVVIGDTPRDVLAAQENGAESVGVATGRFSAAKLRESGATHAFENLSAPGALEAVLGVRS